MKDEDWKPVPGYENRYIVSDEGRVWSVLTGQFLKPYTSDRKCPYQRVSLYDDEGKSQPYVHTIVAWAYLPDRPSEDAQIHHRDSDPENNATENLEWLTPEEHNGVHNGEKDHGEFEPKDDAPF